MQQIRIALRGTAEVLMGKNTMMRKAIRGHLDSNPALEKVSTLGTDEFFYFLELIKTINYPYSAFPPFS